MSEEAKILALSSGAKQLLITAKKMTPLAEKYIDACAYHDKLVAAIANGRFSTGTLSINMQSGSFFSVEVTREMMEGIARETLKHYSGLCLKLRQDIADAGAEFTK